MLTIKDILVLQLKSQTTIVALLDTGNSLLTHCCIRSSIAKELKLDIIENNLSVGSASTKHNLKAIGTTTFTMFLRINETLVPFQMNAIVIDHLSVKVNIGINFLKQ